MEAASPATPSLSARAAASAARRSPGGESAASEHPIDGVVLCSCCGRFPLVGEPVTLRGTAAGQAWACDTCEHLGAAERLGAIMGIDRVRSLGGAANVGPSG